MYKIKEVYKDYDLSDKINCRMIDKTQPIKILRNSSFSSGGDCEVSYTATDGLTCIGFIDRDMLEDWV